MRCFRIFISEHELSGDTVVFSAANSRYIFKVLRLKSGDRVTAFDGRDEHMVRLAHCDRTQVSGVIVESLSQAPRPNFDLTLAFCCVRPGPMAEILRHGTEVGVTRFAPIVSRRANRRPAEKKQRWESVVASACVQSGRASLPEILFPLALEEFIHLNSQASARIILSTAAQALPLLEVLEACAPPLDRVELLIGPEGGFEPSEEAQALSAGFLRGSLGPNVLRTETAAVVATAITVAWRQMNTARRGVVLRYVEDEGHDTETPALRSHSGD